MQVAFLCSCCVQAGSFTFLSSRSAFAPRLFDDYGPMQLRVFLLGAGIGCYLHQILASLLFTKGMLEPDAICAKF